MAYWRAALPIRVGMYVACAAGVGCAAALLITLSFKPWWIGAALVGGAFNNIAPLVFHFSFRRMIRRLDELACLTCGYPLTGLPTPHACPECGTEYLADTARETWKSWFASPRVGRVR